MKSNYILKFFWLITICAILVLTASTLWLVFRAKSPANSGITGHITSSNPTVYMYAQPATTSQIITVLKRDAKVLVTDSQTENSQVWLYVETEIYDGWVPATNFGIDNP
jgi:hypothetical protein